MKLVFLNPGMHFLGLQYTDAANSPWADTIRINQPEASRQPINSHQQQTTSISRPVSGPRP